MAVTELAVCLPIIVLVLFGSIQACNLIYLKYGTVSAAYEGALELSKSNASNSSVESRVQQVLDAQNVTGATITIEPVGTNIAQVAAGSTITIVVDAPVSGNISLISFFPSPSNIETRLVATR
ncbi:pilus assembly protein [Pirellulales bacterium]|nr:pilus assembly protein [Pirellulales bacterium]